MIVVFWLEPPTNRVPHPRPHAQSFGHTEMNDALSWCAALRKTPGVSHVVISAEHPDQVGKLGVDAVQDGKTPDGEVYDWSKAGRAGKMRRGDDLKPSLGNRDGN